MTEKLPQTARMRDWLRGGSSFDPDRSVPNHGLSDRALLVLRDLCWQAGSSDTADVGYEELAVLCARSVRAVTRAMSELFKAGLVTRVAGGRTGRISTYRLCIPEVDSSVRLQQATRIYVPAAQADTPDTQPDTPDAQPDISVHPYSSSQLPPARRAELDIERRSGEVREDANLTAPGRPSVDSMAQAVHVLRSAGSELRVALDDRTAANLRPGILQALADGSSPEAVVRGVVRLCQRFNRPETAGAAKHLTACIFEARERPVEVDDDGLDEYGRTPFERRVDEAKPLATEDQRRRLGLAQGEHLVELVESIERGQVGA